MAAPIPERIRSFLTTYDLLRPDRMVVVAVSGGPDSLCLLHGLHSLAAEGPQLHVAHLDHGLRGAESAAEAAFVAATAAAWQIPATIAQRDVAGLARARRLSKQAAARQVRYAFLAETARALGAAAVAVAHQADDQAETVLLHLVRGAGPAGLRGMRAYVPWHEWRCAGGADKASGQADHAAPDPAPAPCLIRPLLETARLEIEEYCRQHGLEARHDPSNRALSYTRSRIRGRILPLLAEENPRIVAALGRTAALCGEDYDFIQSQLERIWPELADEHNNRVSFARSLWQDLPPTMQRYALRRAARTLADSEELSLAQVEAARTLSELPGGRRHELGLGLRLEVSYNELTIFRPGGTEPDSRFPQLSGEARQLPMPGRLELGSGWSVETRLAPPESGGRWWIALDLAKVDEPLILRRRQPGERFRPAGGQGSRRLQDFFVDLKVPRSYRANWPLLATPSQLIWVAGLRMAEGWAATPATRRTVWVGLVQQAESSNDAQ